MRQFCLQKEFYQLTKQPPIQVSAVAKVREHQLTVWETLQKQGVNAEAASQVMRKSRATLYRRKKRFREKGWAGLEPVSRRPKQL